MRNGDACAAHRSKNLIKVGGTVRTKKSAQMRKPKAPNGQGPKPIVGVQFRPRFNCPPFVEPNGRLGVTKESQGKIREVYTYLHIYTDKKSN